MIAVLLAVVFGILGLVLLLLAHRERHYDVHTPRASYADALASGAARRFAPWSIAISAIAFAIALKTRR